MSTPPDPGSVRLRTRAPGCAQRPLSLRRWEGGGERWQARPSRSPPGRVLGLALSPYDQGSCQPSAHAAFEPAKSREAWGWLACAVVSFLLAVAAPPVSGVDLTGRSRVSVKSSHRNTAARWSPRGRGPRGCRSPAPRSGPCSVRALRGGSLQGPSPPGSPGTASGVCRDTSCGHATLSGWVTAEGGAWNPVTTGAPGQNGWC